MVSYYVPVCFGRDFTYSAALTWLQNDLNSSFNDWSGSDQSSSDPPCWPEQMSDVTTLPINVARALLPCCCIGPIVSGTSRANVCLREPPFRTQSVLWWGPLTQKMGFHSQRKWYSVITLQATPGKECTGISHMVAEQKRIHSQTEPLTLICLRGGPIPAASPTEWRNNAPFYKPVFNLGRWIVFPYSVAVSSTSFPHVPDMDSSYMGILQSRGGSNVPPVTISSVIWSFGSPVQPEQSFKGAVLMWRTHKLTQIKPHTSDW